MKQQPQRRRRRAPKREEVSTTHVRKGIFFLMILLGVVSFCAVAGMLVKLMLVDHDYYEAKAIRNQTRSTSVTASRGTIYDRNGNVLAASSSVENVFLDPLELSQNKVDVPALAKKLAAVLDLDAGWIEEQAADTSLRYKVISAARRRRSATRSARSLRRIRSSAYISSRILSATIPITMSRRRSSALRTPRTSAPRGWRPIIMTSCRARPEPSSRRRATTRRRCSIPMRSIIRRPTATAST